MKKYLLIFLTLGFLVYAQGLFNGFVGDDIYGQIVSNDYLYGFNKIPTLFIYHWSPYYKPIFYLVLNFLLTIFGENAFPFHFTQILIHILNSFLIFLLFSKFFKKNISLFLSLIFLVHPAISEAVFYVSALQDVLYSFFGLLALNFVVIDKLKWKKIIVFSLLTLSIFSKETGVAFLAVVIIYKLLINRENFKQYLLGTGFVLCIYSFIRIGILHVNFLSPQFSPAWTFDIDFYTRLITMPKLIFKYLSLFIWPDKLQITQIWWVREVDLSNFYLPLSVLILIFSIIFIYGFWKYSDLKKKVFPYLFFALWLILGFILHSQIIILDATLAERWFYFPIIGLLGMIGFVLNDIHLEGKRLKVLLIISIFIISMLSLRTFVRSFDWVDDRTLLFHDAKVDDKNMGTAFLIGNYYLRQNDYDKAIDAYSQTRQLSRENEQVDNAFAHLEIKRGNLKKAEEILNRSSKKSLSNKVNYSYVLLLLKEYNRAKSYTLDSLKYYPSSDELYIILSFTEYFLGNREKALDAMLAARKLSPASEIDYGPIYDAIKAGKDIQFKFN